MLILIAIFFGLVEEVLLVSELLGAYVSLNFMSN